MRLSEGLALELRGDATDLNDLREQLRAPFDPWLEEHQGTGGVMLLLRSKAWASLGASRDVLAVAEGLVDKINGALLLEFNGPQPVTLGTIYKIGADGSCYPAPIEATLNVELQGDRLRARAIVGDPRTSSEPRPSPMQSRLEQANQDNRKRDLLVFLSRADNWFDLYMAMEKVEAILGGEREAAQIEAGWKRVKRTANVYRHAPSDTFTLPSVPPTLSEARDIVVRVARQIV